MISVHSICLSMLPDFRDPAFLESVLPGIISGTYMFRTYTAWYDFRILYP